MDHGTLHDEVSRLAEIRHTKAFLNLFPRHVLFNYYFVGGSKLAPLFAESCF